QVLQAGDDWRVSARIALPGRLLAMAGFAGDATIMLAIDGTGAADLEPARPGPVRLFRLDAATMSLHPSATRDGAAASPSLPVRLQRSRDGRCVALLDAAGRWIASAVRD
ncbi:MAG TPA: hypothetical protein PK177_22050, partial [Burkholderiaceae bacterium]|nr:hypothetical protein [Burkholderiaceae bacterium]